MAKSGFSDSHWGPHLYRCLATYRPAKLDYFSKISGQVLHLKDDERYKLNTGGGEGVSNKRKRSRSLVTAGHRVKVGGRLNTLSVTCKLFNGRGGCNWALYERNHKCKECESKDHGLAECTAKGRKKSWQFKAEGTDVTVKTVGIVEIATLADRNTLCQFMSTYPCLPAPPRHNTHIKFRLADVSQASLTNFLSPLKPSAWADLFAQLPKGPQNTPSNNPTFWSRAKV